MNDTETGSPLRTSSQRPRSFASGVRTANVRVAVLPTSQPAQPGRFTVSSTVSCSPAATCVVGRIVPCTMRTGTIVPAAVRTTAWDARPAYHGWIALASASPSFWRRASGQASNAAATAAASASTTTPTAHTSGRRRERLRGRRLEGSIAITP